MCARDSFRSPQEIIFDQQALFGSCWYVRTCSCCSYVRLSKYCCNTALNYLSSVSTRTVEARSASSAKQPPHRPPPAMGKGDQPLVSPAELAGTFKGNGCLMSPDCLRIEISVSREVSLFVAPVASWLSERSRAVGRHAPALARSLAAVWQPLQLSSSPAPAWPSRRFDHHADDAACPCLVTAVWPRYMRAQVLRRLPGSVRVPVHGPVRQLLHRLRRRGLLDSGQRPRRRQVRLRLCARRRRGARRPERRR